MTIPSLAISICYLTACVAWLYSLDTDILENAISDIVFNLYGGCFLTVGWVFLHIYPVITTRQIMQTYRCALYSELTTLMAVIAKISLWYMKLRTKFIDLDNSVMTETMIGKVSQITGVSEKSGNS
jgi:hypothetical protein